MMAPYFAPERGGVETYTLEIATRLRDDFGCEIFVVTTRRGRGPAVVDDGVGFRTYRMPAPWKLSNTPIGRGWRTTLEGIFDVERPDVINAHTPVPFLADVAERARRGIPFVLTVHNDIDKATPIWRLIGSAYYRILGQRTLDASDAVVATSDHYVNGSARLRAQGSKLTVATCGVNMERLRGLDGSLRGPGEERWRDWRVVLFVGSMDATHAHKGLDVLIRALAQVRRRCPDAGLVAIGKGDAIGRYRRLAADVGVGERVIFPGPVDDATLARFYRAADVCVLPSTNRSEGLGLVLIEASACRVPTVGTRVGGVPYAVIDGETGLLVEPGDVNALASAINRILSDPELAEAMGAKGQQYVQEHFSWSAGVAAVFAALNAAIEAARKGPGYGSRRR